MSQISRRSFIKKLTYGTLATVGLSYGGYYYAHEIEPKWLNIVRNNIQSHRIPKSFDQFKILQLSDLHYGFHYGEKELDKLIKTIQKLSFDLIVFTGDLTDDPSIVSQQQFETIINQFSSLEASHGKYWIYGNHDHGGYGTTKIYNVMERCGFKLLRNETIHIKKEDEVITLSGLDDIILGQPNLELLIGKENKDLFNILLCHEPDFADEAKDYPFDIQLSGHSHGGQIQIPFIGYIVTPPLGKKYVEGNHQLGSRPMNLFVSRGIGTTRLPFRFFCRPEINLYTLESVN
ncbi:metallophosphoesterase [Bacillaceae bacterium W0354]